MHKNIYSIKLENIRMLQEGGKREKSINGRLNYHLIIQVFEITIMIEANKIVLKDSSAF